MYEFAAAARVSAPHLLVLNTALAAELGLDAEWLASPGGVEALVGNSLPAGAFSVTNWLSHLPVPTGTVDLVTISNSGRRA